MVKYLVVALLFALPAIAQEDPRIIAVGNEAGPSPDEENVVIGLSNGQSIHLTQSDTRNDRRLHRCV
jgi:hypothetical protein